MACRGFLECMLKLLNFLLTVSGLTIVGYGIYLFVEWKRATSGGGGGDKPMPPGSMPPLSSNADIIALGRPMLLVISLSESIADNLPKAWFIFLFIGIGAVLFFISCVGCVGATARNGCCLSFYSLLLIFLILVELGGAALMFFYHDWRDLIPEDKTGNFIMIYDFLKEHWKIVRWVALGIVILETLVFILGLAVRSANLPADYDSDDEYIVAPRSTLRQPLVNRQESPAAGVPAAGGLDQRLPSRNDAWSKRMREKYGLDTSEFTYNPSDPGRYPQAATPREESRCAIL
ncbi:tobamovirus multiplication 2A [Wolffia australiana]